MFFVEVKYLWAQFIHIRSKHLQYSKQIITTSTFQLSSQFDGSQKILCVYSYVASEIHKFIVAVLFW